MTLQDPFEDQAAPVASAQSASEDLAILLPAATIQEAADYLREGYWDEDGDDLRSYDMSDDAITGNNGVLYYDHSALLQVTGVSAQKRQDTRDLIDQAFAYLGEVLGITFIDYDTVANPPPVDEVDITFIGENDSLSNASATLHATGNGDADHRYVQSGTVNLGLNTGAAQVDSSLWDTIVHEVLHLMGLGHQGPYDGGSSGLNYVQSASDPDYLNKSNIFLNDSVQLSIMSYFTDFNGAPSNRTNTYVDAEFGAVMTAMQADLQALSVYYDVGGFAGNTVYGFNTNITATPLADLADHADSMAFSLIDESGYDTVDFSGFGADQRIDLTVTQADAAGLHASDIGGRTGNMTLAVGTVIEAARGGFGNDEIIGNGANNALHGNGGNDTLTGLAGADMLYGGTGDDWLFGGFGTDGYYGGSGSDTVDFSYSSSNWTIDPGVGGLGSASNAFGSEDLHFVENIIGSQGRDRITERNGINNIDAHDGNDTVVVTTAIGSDSFDGGTDEDTIDWSASAQEGGVYNLELGFALGDGQIEQMNNFENFIGTDQGDWVTESFAANSIRTGAGDDTVFVHTTIGVDAYYGGSGIDTIDWSGSTQTGATFEMGVEARTAFGAEAMTGFENLVATQQADTIIEGNGPNRIDARGGDDIVRVVSVIGVDSLDGGTDEDTVDWSASSQSHGVYDLDAGTASTLANTEVMANFENFIGTDQDDTVIDGTGGNAIALGGGDDRLITDGAIAFNDFDGGSGTDTLDVSAANWEGRTYDFAAGEMRFQSGMFATVDPMQNFENLIGSDAAETVIDASGFNVLDLGGGDDWLDADSFLGSDSFDGGAGEDTANYSDANAPFGASFNLSSGLVVGLGIEGLSNFENLVASAFDDRVTGTDGVNSLAAGAGEDEVEGRGGGDSMTGGAGFDTLSYLTSEAGVSVDLLTGTAVGGDATGDAFDGFEALVGSGHADRLTGTNGTNSLDGGEGNDILRGRAGPDHLLGGGGFDFADYSDAPGPLTIDLENPGASSVYFAQDTLVDIRGLFGARGFENTFNGDANRTFFIGGEASDQIDGNGGGDILRGRDGADLIDGGAGRDALLGNGGNDVLTGGADPDIFWFGIGDEGDDTITDFDGAEDLIGFQGDAVNNLADLVVTPSAGGWALLEWGTSSVELVGIEVSDLSPGSFVFI